jgi:aryl-alcohol dehydrogenase-like predicted oxidoreductase
MNAQKLIPKKPVMGLGLAALGRPGYINLGHNRDIGPDKSREAMSRRAYEVLDKAYLLGLRYFDAARSYGQAEAFLATWLQKKRPDDVFIASKWGYTYTADWQVEAHVHEHKEHSVAVLERQWAESKNLLGDYLQLYQIHSATFQSGVLDNTEVLRRLWRLREQGIHIGITVSGAEQAAIIGKAMAIGRDGQQLFSSVQATWNLLAQSVAPMLEKRQLKESWWSSKRPWRMAASPIRRGWTRAHC